MSDIEFHVNEFHTYTTVVDGISLGFIDTGSGAYNPKPGEKLTYDGVTVVLEDGRRFGNVPQLRSAIRQGWFSLVGKETGSYRPKAAGVKIRDVEHRGSNAPVMTQPVFMREEDHTVGDVEHRRMQRERTNERAARRVPAEVAGRRKAGDGVEEIWEDLSFAASQWRAQHSGAGSSDVFEKAESRLIDLLDAMNEPPATPEGRGYPLREDATETAGRVVAQVGRDEEASVETRSLRSNPLVVNEERHVGDIALSGSPTSIKLDDRARVSATTSGSVRIAAKAEVGRGASTISVSDQEGVAVGRILSPAKQRFVASASNTSSSAIEVAASKRVGVKPIAARVDVAKENDVPPVTQKDVGIAGYDLADVLPEAAVAPRSAPAATNTTDAILATVRTMIPDFAWDRDRPVTERVKEAVRVKDPLRLRGILAVETPIAREAIEKAIGTLGKT